MCFLSLSLSLSILVKMFTVHKLLLLLKIISFYFIFPPLMKLITQIATKEKYRRHTSYRVNSNNYSFKYFSRNSDSNF